MGILTHRDQNRVYVPAHLWGSQYGTDFHLVAGTNLLGSTTTQNAIVDAGWTTTSLALVAGSAADFMSSADEGIPPHILTDASGDLLKCEPIFGTYRHANMAWRILNGDMRLTGTPSRLNFEVHAAFSVASAAETTSGFGFIEDAGTPATANDALAYIYSDGTNFKLRSGAATSAAGAAVDNLWHRWRVSISSVGVYWYIDGLVQNTTVLAQEADEYPVSFGMHSLTTNRILFGSVAIWYD